MFRLELRLIVGPFLRLLPDMLGDRETPRFGSGFFGQVCLVHHFASLLDFKVVLTFLKCHDMTSRVKWFEGKIR